MVRRPGIARDVPNVKKTAAMARVVPSCVRLAQVWGGANERRRCHSPPPTVKVTPNKFALCLIANVGHPPRRLHPGGVPRPVG